MWKQPDAMRLLSRQFGTDLQEQNGDDSLEVSLLATILVGKDGVVRNAHLEPDHTKDLSQSLR
jgi:hypothetical protein